MESVHPKFLTFALAAIVGSMFCASNSAAQKTSGGMEATFKVNRLNDSPSGEPADVSKMDDIDDILSGTKGARHRGSSSKTTTQSRDAMIDDIFKIAPAKTKSVQKKPTSHPSRIVTSDDLIRAADPAQPNAHAAKPDAKAQNSKAAATANSTKAKSAAAVSSDKGALSKVPMSKVPTPKIQPSKSTTELTAKQKLDAKLRQLVAPANNLPNPNSLSFERALEVATKCVEKKQQTESIPFFSRAISLAPTNGKILAQRGVAYDQVGQFADALNDFNRSMSLKYDIEVEYKKIETLIHLGRAAEAAAACDVLAQQNSNDVKPVMTKARIFLSSNPTAVVAVLSPAIAAHPNEADLYFLRALAYKDLNLPTEAMADVNNEIQVGGNTAKALFVKASIEGNLLNNYNQALIDYDAALRLEPHNREALISRCNLAHDHAELTKYRADIDTLITADPYDAPAWVLLSKYYVDTQQYDLVLETAARIRQLTPYESSGYIQAVIAMYHNKDYKAALALLNQGLKHLPQDGYLYNAVAYIEFTTKDYDKAIADANHAIALTPRNISPYVVLANTQLELKQYNEALATIAKSEAARAIDTTGNACLCKVDAFKALNQKDRALADLNQAISAHPEQVNLLAARADMAEADKRYKDAISDFVQCSKLRPTNDYYPLKIGELYLNLSNYDEAQRYFKAALDLDPTESSAYLGMGNSFLNQEKYKDALAWFNKGVNAEPTRDWLRYKVGIAEKNLGNYQAALEAFTKIAKPSSDTDGTYGCEKGVAEAFLARPAEALADINAALKLNASVVNYFRRTFIELALGQGDNALSDADTILAQAEKKPDDDSTIMYAKILVAVTGSQAHQDQKFKTAVSHLKSSAPWPQPILAWLAGKLSLAELESKAKNNDDQKDVKIYTGLKLLADGNADQAAENFRWIVNHSDNNNVEKAFAICWLHAHDPKSADPHAPKGTEAHDSKGSDASVK